MPTRPATGSCCGGPRPPRGELPVDRDAVARRSGAGSGVPGSQVFRQFAAAPDHWLRFRVLDPVVEVKVMVVALGPHGHEVSRSRIVTVTTGGDVTGEVPAGPDPPPDDGGGGSSP